MRTSNFIRTIVALAALWIVTPDPARAAETAPFVVPDEITMPSGPDGAAVRDGGWAAQAATSLPAGR